MGTVYFANLLSKFILAAWILALFDLDSYSANAMHDCFVDSLVQLLCFFISCLVECLSYSAADFIVVAILF